MTCLPLEGTVSTWVTKPIWWDPFSFQKKRRKLEIHPISISLHPAAGSTAPRVHLTPDTAGVLQSSAALHLLLGRDCLSQGQSVNSRNFRVFCIQKNHQEESSCSLECWGEGPAGFQVLAARWEPVGLEGDPTAPLWLLRTRRTRHV